MEISLDYGKAGLKLSLDDKWQVSIIEKKNMPILEDPKGAISTALSQGIPTGSLEDAAQGKSSVCILICDITRPVPNGLILPRMIERLTRAGIKEEKITVLVATGLHRPNLGEELLEVVGSSEVLERVNVENHYARRDEDHVTLGTSPSGLPVRIDKRFAGADLKIVIGLVEPHFMAGYSGGRKLIIPGVAHHETITGFHTAEYLEHPGSRNCNLEGNVFHEFQMEGIRNLSNLFAVNVVIDEKRNLSYVNFGDIELSHAQAIEYLKRHAQIDVPERFFTIITGAGGYPLDKTYYQTVKSMVSPMDILEPGGDLIVASECSEGMGSAEYYEAQRLLSRLGEEAFLEELKTRKYAKIDEWQTEMQLKPMRVGNIHLYAPRLSDPDKKFTCVRDVRDLNQTIRESVARSGNPKIAVIPEGPYVVPVYRG